MECTAPIKLAPTSKAIIKFYSQCREIIIEETAMRVADTKDQAVCLGHCVAALLKLLDIVLDDFLKSGYIVFMQDLIVIAIAATALRLVRCLSSVDPSTRSLITQKISTGAISSASSVEHLPYVSSYSWGRLPKRCRCRPFFDGCVPEPLHPSTCQKNIGSFIHIES